MEGMIQFSVPRKTLEQLRRMHDEQGNLVLRYGDTTIPLVINRDLPPDMLILSSTVGKVFVQIVTGVSFEDEGRA